MSCSYVTNSLSIEEVDMGRVTIQNTKSVELEKRTPLPFKFSMLCPSCNNEITTDLSMSYLRYPMIPGKNKVYFYCGADLGEEYCVYEEHVWVDFQMTAQIVE
jgi:hypothetical protein